jgi:crossover junction endodeoxyribonuclease RuvC
MNTTKKRGNVKAEKVILGIDPGTLVTGYGVVLVNGQKLSLQQYGVIHLRKYGDLAVRLEKIFTRVIQIIEDYHPDHMALEAPFYGKNPQALIKLGRAQGVAMAAALSRQIPITEYAPKRVKQSVTGNGNASKEQVANMIMRILDFQQETEKQMLDATDALAVALCHHYENGSVSSASGKKSWGDFVRENPDRLK